MNGKNITILGAGSWGFAVANLLCGKGNRVSMWEFDSEACETLKETRKLPTKLPGILLDDDIFVTNEIEDSVSEADFVFCAIPAQYLRSAIVKLKILKAKPVFVNLAKGIEVGSLKRMSEILEEEIAQNSRSGICTLSGPSHAEEVARDLPTTVTVASRDLEIAEMVQRLMTSPNFRVYTSRDILGVELAGSLKNVIALAAGMLDGLKMGDNTRGALLTRGLAEMVRLGIKMGADPVTFSGLAGIGDLVTTCLSKYSRNRFVGDQIGSGRKLKNVLAHMTMVAEGVETARSAYELARKYDVEMPITLEVFKVLFEDKRPADAIGDLMARDPKPEGWQ